MARYGMYSNQHPRSPYKMSQEIIGRQGHIWLTGKSAFDIDRGGVITFPYPDVIDTEAVITTQSLSAGSVGFGTDTKNLYVFNDDRWYKFDTKYATWNTHDPEWDAESYQWHEDDSDPI